MKRLERCVVGAGRCLLLLGMLASAACSASGGTDPYDESSSGNGTTAGGGNGSGPGSGAGPGPTSGVGSSGSGSGVGSSGSGMTTGSGPNVTFDWPESVAGAKCLAGKYQGMFDGIYMSSLTVFPAPIPVAGNVNITLGQSANGEFFEITDGKLDGVADLVFPFLATIEGGLDCKTLKFTGLIKMGQYTAFAFVIGFEGEMPSDYDKVSHTFINGKWSVHEMNPIYGGSGNWNATWVSP